MGCNRGIRSNDLVSITLVFWKYYSGCCVEMALVRDQIRCIGQSSCEL